jgi:hypothetical protein
VSFFKNPAKSVPAWTPARILSLAFTKFTVSMGKQIPFLDIVGL